MIFFLLVFLANFNFGKSDIIGEPKIRCAPTGITIMLEADSPFKGALFLRGSADKKSCKADFSTQPSQNISFEFGFDECPSRRKRQVVAPRGMTMSSVLVVSYHGSIITHRDVAYQIDCFYREQNSRVETMLAVNAPQPRILSDAPKLPTCDYRVEVAGGKAVAGGVVTSSLSESSQVANVGDSVIHIWTCSGDAPSDVYCIQVYSCTAEDGGADNVQVVDENGCTTDGELLSPIKYKEGSMRAAASSHAFKFVDNHIVYFKCNIRITVKNPAGECPINNCSPNGSVSRKTRSTSSSVFPFILFRKSAPRPKWELPEYNIPVTSGEIIVEEERAKNHILSMYRPEEREFRYSYKNERYSPIVNSADGRKIRIQILTVALMSILCLF